MLILPGQVSNHLNEILQHWDLSKKIISILGLINVVFNLMLVVFLHFSKV